MISRTAIEFALGQLDGALESCKWAMYHHIHGNEAKESAYAQSMRRYLQCAGLFINDAINKGDKDGKDSN